MDPIYFDTETCGFHGPAVLIQWAEGDGPVHLHEVWTQPIVYTLELIRKIANHPGGVVGFNLSFDWFHLCQLYTTLSLMPDHSDFPDECIDQYALLEPSARDGACLKPVKALDLMLHARKGPYQSTMGRKDIRIRRVPSVLAWQLAAELESRVPLPDIYFAKRSDKHAPRWSVKDIEDSFGDIEPDFKDLLLSFAPSSALKVLAIDALKIPVDKTLLFADINVEDAFIPEELGYAPFALAIGQPGRWNKAWPEMIPVHINHWRFNTKAREYATLDVEYLQRLDKHFGYPERGDDDSELACMVGAVRWRGYRVDLEGIQKLKEESAKVAGRYPTAPDKARDWIMEVMDPTERVVLRGKVSLQESTKKTVLETIVKELSTQPCVVCNGECFLNEYTKCDHCDGAGFLPHPAVERAQNVLDARRGEYEVDFYDKLLLAGRLHASFDVIGTLSSRMSGRDGLNSQGIKNAKEVRSQFPLAWAGLILCGGDFAGFEVVLAEACYNDPDLRRDLTTQRPCHKCGATGVGKKGDACGECKGTGQTDTKIHALFGQFVFPHLTYEQILADIAIYTRCKQAVFAMLYGGEGYTLQDRLAVPLEIAEAAYEEFCRRYPGVARNRQKIIDMFQSMRQPGGIGKEVEWHEPADYIESMLGFRRHFTLENRIAKALYLLANSPPQPWAALRTKVTRRDREQTAMGAVQSALYGAAFALQAANTRAAANHVIQSSGATITKRVQRRIWDIQPSGVNSWYVQPMNVHDEIMCPTDPAYVEQVAEAVATTVESFRPKVPLIKMEWERSMGSWAEK